MVFSYLHLGGGEFHDNFTRSLRNDCEGFRDISTQAVPLYLHIRPWVLRYLYVTNSIFFRFGVTLPSVSFGIIGGITFLRSKLGLVESDFQPLVIVRFELICTSQVFLSAPSKEERDPRRIKPTTRRLEKPVAGVPGNLNSLLRQIHELVLQDEIHGIQNATVLDGMGYGQIRVGADVTLGQAARSGESGGVFQQCVVAQFGLVVFAELTNEGYGIPALYVSIPDL